MKNIFQKYLLLFLLISFGQSAFSQIKYRSRYKSAILIEGFGLSPIMSLNYEVAPLRYNNGFFAARLGVGYLPAKAGDGAGYSFPAGVSYNLLLNNLKKGIAKRVMNKCKSKPPKFDIEYFSEFGLGYAKVIYPNSANRDYFNLLVAFKAQFVIDKPPKAKVFQVKVSVNPRVTRDGLIFYEKSPEGGQNFFGGFAIGFSI